MAPLARYPVPSDLYRIRYERFSQALSLRGLKPKWLRMMMEKKMMMILMVIMIIRMIAILLLVLLLVLLALALALGLALALALGLAPDS